MRFASRWRLAFTSLAAPVNSLASDLSEPQMSQLLGQCCVVFGASVGSSVRLCVQLHVDLWPIVRPIWGTILCRYFVVFCLFWGGVFVVFVILLCCFGGQLVGQLFVD